MLGVSAAAVKEWVDSAVADYFGASESVLVTYITKLVQQCTPPVQIEKELAAVFGDDARTVVKKLCLFLIQTSETPPPPPPPPS